MATASLGLSFEASKRYFFDRAKVLAAADAAVLRGLSRLGAFVRRRARTSLRRRKKASAPGSPPSVHSKDNFATLKNILFAYDPARRSVVVGPVRLNGSKGSPTVPELHEFGGTLQVAEAQLSGGRWVRAGLARRFGDKSRPTRVRAATYPARPTMRPALAAEIAAGTAPRAFSNAFGRAA